MEFKILSGKTIKYKNNNRVQSKQTAIMEEEVQSASRWLKAILVTKLSISSEKANQFGRVFEAKLQEKYKGHWYADAPNRGQAYRLIVIQENAIDAVVTAACEKAKISPHIFFELFQKLKFWIDPNLVEAEFFLRQPTTSKVTYPKLELMQLFPEEESGPKHGSSPPSYQVESLAPQVMEISMKEMQRRDIEEKYLSSQSNNSQYYHPYAPPSQYSAYTTNKYPKSEYNYNQQSSSLNHPAVYSSDYRNTSTTNVNSNNNNSSNNQSHRYQHHQQYRHYQQFYYVDEEETTIPFFEDEYNGSNIHPTYDDESEFYYDNSDYFTSYDAMSQLLLQQQQHQQQQLHENYAQPRPLYISSYY